MYIHIHIYLYISRICIYVYIYTYSCTVCVYGLYHGAGYPQEGSSRVPSTRHWFGDFPLRHGANVSDEGTQALGIAKE